MKRIALAVVLLVGGVLGAQADTDVWVSIQPRHDPNAAAQIDADYCTRLVGPDLNGKPTPVKFKRCAPVLEDAQFGEVLVRAGL